MANMNFFDNIFIENLLEIDINGVLGMSSEKLNCFVKEASGNKINLSDKKYQRKKYNSDANILRRVIETEENEVVASILNALVQKKEQMLYDQKEYISNNLTRTILYAKQIIKTLQDTKNLESKSVINIKLLSTLIMAFVLISYIIHIDVKAYLYSLDGATLFPSFAPELKFQEAFFNTLNLFFSTAWSMSIIIFFGISWDIADKVIKRKPWTLIVFKSVTNKINRNSILGKLKNFVCNILLKWLAILCVTVLSNFPRSAKSFFYSYLAIMALFVLMLFADSIYTYNLNSFLKENPDYCQIALGKIKTKELINIDSATNSIYYWTESGTVLQMENGNSILLPMLLLHREAIFRLCNRSIK